MLKVVYNGVLMGLSGFRIKGAILGGLQDLLWLSPSTLSCPRLSKVSLPQGLGSDMVWEGMSPTWETRVLSTLVLGAIGKQEHSGWLNRVQIGNSLNLETPMWFLLGYDLLSFLVAESGTTLESPGSACLLTQRSRESLTEEQSYTKL